MSSGGDGSGCVHYRNLCEILAPCCNRYYRCFRCHDESDDGCGSSLDRKSVAKIRCVVCNTEQEPSQTCKHCRTSFAEYVCLDCSLYRENDPNGVGFYHCVDCGFCRVGKGLGISHWHCHSCCACLSLELIDPEEHGKVCLPNASKNDCPICFEPMHDSQKECVVGYYCGHYLHKSCCDAYFRTGKIKCPMCQKPLVKIREPTRFETMAATTWKIASEVWSVARPFVVFIVFGSMGIIESRYLNILRLLLSGYIFFRYIVMVFGYFGLFLFLGVLSLFAGVLRVLE